MRWSPRVPTACAPCPFQGSLQPPWQSRAQGSPRPRGRKLFVFPAALASALSVPTHWLSLALIPSPQGHVQLP